MTVAVSEAGFVVTPKMRSEIDGLVSNVHSVWNWSNESDRCVHKFSRKVLDLVSDEVILFEIYKVADGQNIWFRASDKMIRVCFGDAHIDFYGSTGSLISIHGLEKDVSQHLTQVILDSPFNINVTSILTCPPEIRMIDSPESANRWYGLRGDPDIDTRHVLENPDNNNR